MTDTENRRKILRKIMIPPRYANYPPMDTPLPNHPPAEKPVGRRKNAKFEMPYFANLAIKKGPLRATAGGATSGHEDGGKRAFVASGENADTSTLCEGGGKGMVKPRPRSSPGNETP